MGFGSFLVCFALQVQVQTQIPELKAANGTITMLSVENTAEQLPLAQPQAIFQKYLAPNPAVSFTFVSNFTNKKGNIHQKYQQYYKGLPVAHGQYNAMYSGENLYFGRNSSVLYHNPLEVAMCCKP